VKAYQSQAITTRAKEEHMRVQVGIRRVRSLVVGPKAKPPKSSNDHKAKRASRIGVCHGWVTKRDIIVFFVTFLSVLSIGLIYTSVRAASRNVFCCLLVKF
jgi:hypothetical protein